MRPVVIVATLVCAVFLIAAAITAVLSRSGGSAPLTATASSSASAAARRIAQFTAFPVFYVGSEYRGQPLDGVFGPTPDGWEEPMVLTYGSCGDDFTSGCTEPIVIKTIPRCYPGLGVTDSSITIRGRAVSEAPNLTVETGSGTVVIYADKATALAVANDMVVANVDAFRQYAQIRADDPLPGSLCELARLHPRAYPTPATPDAYTPDASAATVFAGFGDVGIFTTYEEAAKQLGWTPLRNNDPRFTVSQEAGIGAWRRFKSALPDFEEMYEMIGRSAPIMLTEEPESYPLFPLQHTTREQLGSWDVQLFNDSGDVGAVFYSGASLDGQRIRVVAHAPSEYGFNLNDIRQFVRALTKG